MAFSVDVKFNDINKIIADHNLQENGKVAFFIAQDIYRLSEPYTPRDSGNLYRNVTIKGGEITYNAPYAHYQYYGMAMVDKNGSAFASLGQKKHYNGKSLQYHNGGMRGKQWDKRLINDRLRDIINDTMLYLNRG